MVCFDQAKTQMYGSEVPTPNSFAHGSAPPNMHLPEACNRGTDTGLEWLERMAKSEERYKKRIPDRYVVAMFSTAEKKDDMLLRSIGVLV